MRSAIENLLVRLWNRIRSRSARSEGRSTTALDLGAKYSEDSSVRGRITISQRKRSEHIAILGRTGSGKSSLVRYLAKQDIATNRGFVFFDIHGDATPFLLREVAAREKASAVDLSDRLIVIDPSDSDFSVGTESARTPKQQRAIRPNSRTRADPQATLAARYIWRSD